jgi:hypothetical protein
VRSCPISLPGEGRTGFATQAVSAAPWASPHHKPAAQRASNRPEPGARLWEPQGSAWGEERRFWRRARLVPGRASGRDPENTAPPRLASVVSRQSLDRRGGPRHAPRRRRMLLSSRRARGGPRSNPYLSPGERRAAAQETPESAAPGHLHNSCDLRPKTLRGRTRYERGACAPGPLVSSDDLVELGATPATFACPRFERSGPSSVPH